MINALEWHPMTTPWSLGVWEVSSQFTDTIQHVRWYILHLSHLSTSFHLPWMGKNKLKKKGDLTSLITSCTNATKIITLTIDFDCICGLSEWNIDQYSQLKSIFGHLFITTCYGGSWTSPHWNWFAAAASHQQSISITKSDSGNFCESVFTTCLLDEHANQHSLQPSENPS